MYRYNQMASSFTGYAVWSIIALILAIIALLIGISYLVQGIYARGLGGVNYGSVIFPLLVGVIAVYFMKKN